MTPREAPCLNAALSRLSPRRLHTAHQDCVPIRTSAEVIEVFSVTNTFPLLPCFDLRTTSHKVRLSFFLFACLFCKGFRHKCFDNRNLPQTQTVRWWQDNGVVFFFSYFNLGLKSCHTHTHSIAPSRCVIQQATFIFLSYIGPDVIITSDSIYSCVERKRVFQILGNWWKTNCFSEVGLAVCLYYSIGFLILSVDLLYKKGHSNGFLGFGLQ